MAEKIPILLSFYGISSLDNSMLVGQITYSTVADLTFKDYSRRKTFRTLFRLYRTKPYARQKVLLTVGGKEIEIETDKYGAFIMRVESSLGAKMLESVQMASGTNVKMLPDLYSLQVKEMPGDFIVVSDIDDTILHSYIFKKALKFRTLMFTAVEKRKAVHDMQGILKQLTEQGATSVYLSNSEQNLHPLIYRFLTHNGFPKGPLFLKKMRRLRDVIFNIKFPLKDTHKRQTLIELLSFFDRQKFILMGDNTQQDMAIYIDTALKFPDRIQAIVIRQVVQKESDYLLLDKHRDTLAANGIKIFYDDSFPTFSLGIIQPNS